jgi:hypothetical protein
MHGYGPRERYVRESPPESHSGSHQYPKNKKSGQRDLLWLRDKIQVSPLPEETTFSQVIYLITGMCNCMFLLRKSSPFSLPDRTSSFFLSVENLRPCHPSLMSTYVYLFDVTKVRRAAEPTRLWTFLESNNLPDSWLHALGNRLILRGAAEAVSDDIFAVPLEISAFADKELAPIEVTMAAFPKRQQIPAAPRSPLSIAPPASPTPLVPPAECKLVNVFRTTSDYDSMVRFYLSVIRSFARERGSCFVSVLVGGGGQWDQSILDVAVLEFKRCN